MPKSRKFSQLVTAGVLISAFMICVLGEANNNLLRQGLPTPAGIINPQDMCGDDDDSQDVERYDGRLGISKEFVKRYQESTFQLQWESKEFLADHLEGYVIGTVADNPWCTATLLENNLALTAGHCFDQRDGTGKGWVTPFKLLDNKEKKPAGPKLLAKMQKANFQYQYIGRTDEIREVISFPVIKLLEYRLMGLDYALIELGADRDGKYASEFIPFISIDEGPIAEDEMLVIIQHPNGNPKRVDAGKLLSVSGPIFTYDDIDTYDASSGSGVLSRQGTLVAVHTSGGCQYGEGNIGVSAVAIVEASTEL